MGFILQYGYVLCHRKVSDLYVRNRGIALLSLTQIDLDIGTTIKGMMFHHRPITQCVRFAKYQLGNSCICHVFDGCSLVNTLELFRFNFDCDIKSTS